jgi:hypothetical protein
VAEATRHIEQKASKSVSSLKDKAGDFWMRKKQSQKSDISKDVARTNETECESPHWINLRRIIPFDFL